MIFIMRVEYTNKIHNTPYNSFQRIFFCWLIVTLAVVKVERTKISHQRQNIVWVKSEQRILYEGEEKKLSSNQMVLLLNAISHKSIMMVVWCVAGSKNTGSHTQTHYYPLWKSFFFFFCIFASLRQSCCDFKAVQRWLHTLALACVSEFCMAGYK